ncbi:replication-associated protein [Circoviridae 4 LDMD-2013]|uniref:replication-associated protein n=1 Tax=Circoviridae 4 LDMD-2013 TaxID=1379708 RepID=UPI00038457F7|nr:replication-associated protein [Circoviridae 4 LDMD-2013]AGS36187.1 replication-associated protein [Circoviridae 4 LDMD-2013]AGS36232.1 replication-associated protein [Circoviridae 17 LDMD-2013]
MSRSRGWVFTAQAGSSGLSAIATLLDNVDCDYMVYQEETGAGGRKHLQGFVWWRTQRTFNSVKGKLPDGVHLEKQRGTNKEAADYCRKVGPGGWNGGHRGERGEQPADAGRPTGGSKHAVEALRKAQKHGVKRVLDEDPECFLKHHTALEKAARLEATARVPQERDLTVWWIHGDAGSGKSRFATRYDNPDNTCIISDSAGGWLDGYAGQRTLVIDDFEGLMPYQQIKRMLDVYRYQAPVKGDHVAAEWTTVLITSNEHPSSYYQQDRWSNDPTTPSPLQRRITAVYKVTGCHPGPVTWTPPQPAPRPPAVPPPPPPPPPPMDGDDASEEEEEGGPLPPTQRVSLSDSQLLADGIFDDFLDPTDLFPQPSSGEDIFADLDGVGDPEPQGQALC